MTSNSHSLKLKKFDMSSIDSNSVCVFIGKRNTGKSYCLKDLLYYHQDIPSGVVISATEKANKFYHDFIPPIFINYEYSNKIVKNFLSRQEDLQQKKVNDPLKYQKLDNRSFLIFDDLMYDTSWIKHKEVREIFMNGRHYKIFYLVTMQYPLGIPPVLRSNIDYVFIMRENIFANKKRLYENYAGMFPNLEVFSQVLDKCTEDYGCLVVNNKSRSNKLEDQVFWYKAREHKKFKLCSEKAWNYSKEKYIQDTYQPFNYEKKNKIRLDISKINY